MQEAHAFAARPIATLYETFADETAPTSPVWERLCRWIAATPRLCRLLDTLPGLKRQPNLFLGAVRYLEGPTEPGQAFLAWAEGNWPRIADVVARRATQTNEPGRCAAFSPLLASLPQPVALLEIGASAGLCLLPDRYCYDLDGTRIDGADARPGAPVIASRFTGVAPASPADLRVAFRAGLDANPLDASDPEDARWLRSLVWPGEREREQRLASALRVAAEDPPKVLRGTLPQDLPRLLDLAPAGATPVVLHSAVLAYLAPEDRAAVIDQIRSSGAHWLSFEGTSVVEEVRGDIPDGSHFVLALDGQPVAISSPHGAWVDWLN